MKKKGKKIAFKVSRLFIILLFILLISYFATIASGFFPFFRESASQNSISLINKDKHFVEHLIEKRFEDLQGVVDDLGNHELTSSNDVNEVLSDYIGSDSFGSLRYFSKGKVYDYQGFLVDSETYADLYVMSGKNRRGFVGSYFDASLNFDCVAFYIPVIGSDYIDGIMSIIQARDFIAFQDTVNLKNQFVAVISTSGNALVTKYAEGFRHAIGNNYFDFIEEITTNSVKANIIKNNIANNNNNPYAMEVVIDSEKYTTCAAPLEIADNNLYFVTLARSIDLATTEISFLRHVITALILTLISLGVSLVYALLYYKHSKKELTIANLTDPLLGCANTEQFRLNCIEILRKSVNRKYAVVVLQIRSFNNYKTLFGEQNSELILKFIAKIIDNFCDEDETFGYNGTGGFMVLHRYANESYLSNKIHLLEGITNKNEIVVGAKTTIKFNVGISYAFGDKKIVMRDIISNAMSASEYAKIKTNLPYVIYTEDVNKKMVHDEQIEAQMENALKNGDFRLFLQPKYNVKFDRIDSAEALVRWFDPRTGNYIFPVEFIDLFEANGFIVKLDHYIYLEVLSYFKSAVEHGDKIVPVSVNVSRVTASSEDFIDFYVGNKKRFGVGDNFITLEFTESFAMEDYEKISSIVHDLHQSGIRCSIDDFGSGYSSFNILKNIHMDELKLDRFFIEKGYDEKRDDILLKTIIDLAKSLGMIVVQEGIETKEVMDKIISMHCDVVQGFYYAKAISLEEYKIFIKTNTSLKYKSQVK